jgi:hypothetical protein
MKTLLLGISVLACSVLTAADDQYVSKMKETIRLMDQCQTPEEYQEVANTFEVIAEAEKDKWHPYYYNALVYGIMSMQVPDFEKKDLYAEKAQSAISSGLEIEPEESEFYVLKAFALYAAIQVDPMTRGMDYMMQAEQALAKAEELNADNPRIYFMRAQATLNMPVEYGGGPEAALPVLKKAKEKYDSEVRESELDPVWGREDINQILRQIETGEE